LCNAARVNNTWASAATRQLWIAPPEKALIHITDPRCRQFYAKSICQLMVSSKLAPSVGDDDNGVDFPRLRLLQLLVPLPISRFKRYLVPSLTTLHHYGRLPLQLSQHVSELCPNLRSVQIAIRTPYGDVNGEKSELSALLEFFRRCSLPLTTVRLICFKHDCAESRAAFQHLARRPMLADLDMAGSDIAGGNAFFRSVEEAATLGTGSSRPPTSERGGGAGEEVAIPFRHLRRLSTRTSSQQIMTFLRGAPSLTNLHMNAIGSECVAVFAALPTPLSALTELSDGIFDARWSGSAWVLPRARRQRPLQQFTLQFLNAKPARCGHSPSGSGSAEPGRATAGSDGGAAAASTIGGQRHKRFLPVAGRLGSCCVFFA
jgi:hypothetical protein